MLIIFKFLFNFLLIIKNQLNLMDSLLVKEIIILDKILVLIILKKQIYFQPSKGAVL